MHLSELLRCYGVIGWLVGCLTHPVSIKSIPSSLITIRIPLYLDVTTFSERLFSDSVHRLPLPATLLPDVHVHVRE